METIATLDFGNMSVAKAYDRVLVPYLFDPWTKRLIEENQPWSSRYVLDLACGTGAVTKQLLNQVTCKGKVFALDVNETMLAVNKSKFEELGCDDAIEFIHSSAEKIPLENESIDVIVCQQGFQFFPDKHKAAEEIFRVLHEEGKVIVSTWLPVSDCEIFGAFCKVLEEMGEMELSRLMRIPFDNMPKETLVTAFKKTGFKNIEIEKQEMELHLPGSLQALSDFIYSTPIGPRLKELTIRKQERILELLFSTQMVHDDTLKLGKMTTHVLKAEK